MTSNHHAQLKKKKSTLIIQFKRTKKKLTFPAAGAGQIPIADQPFPALAPMRPLPIPRRIQLRTISILMAGPVAGPRQPPAELHRLNFQRNSGRGVAVESLGRNRRKKVIAAGPGEVLEVQETGGSGAVLSVAANTSAVNRAIGGLEFGLNHRRRQKASRNRRRTVL